MDNKVIVKTLPVTIPDNKKHIKSWQIREIFAIQDLECAQMTIARLLEHDIAVQFGTEIVLTLSINIRTFKIKIDYSEIKSKTSVRLIKLYLSRDIDGFAEEWFKLL